MQSRIWKSVKRNQEESCLGHPCLQKVFQNLLIKMCSGRGTVDLKCIRRCKLLLGLLILTSSSVLALPFRMYVLWRAASRLPRLLIHIKGLWQPIEVTSFANPILKHSPILLNQKLRLSLQLGIHASQGLIYIIIERSVWFTEWRTQSQEQNSCVSIIPCHHKVKTS